MSRISWISTIAAVGALSLVACSGDKGDTGGGAEDGGGSGDDGECSITFTHNNPGDGETEWYYKAALEVELSEADDTTDITVTDAGGAAVDGSVSFSENGLTAYFTPSADLAPSTSYTVDVSVCSGGGSGSIGFSTSDLGTPLACDLTGDTFRVNLAEARFLKPAGVAALLLDALEDDILVGVQSMGESELDMLGALSDGLGGGQNLCYPSIPFPPASFDDPAFEVGPADTTLNVSGIELEISNLSISGAFASDCSYFGGGQLAGELDARVLGPLVGDLLGVTDPDEICGLLVTFGVTCDTCSSDGEPYCADILVDQIVASNAAITLSCVSLEECHPSCPTSGDNPECADPLDGVCD